MDDRRLESLIRMAREAEDFSAECTTISKRPITRNMTLRTAAPFLGVAASIGLVLCAGRPAAAPAPRAALPDTCVVSPTVAAGPTVVRSIAVEPTSLLAILRTWSDECECLQWRVHEWSDGQNLARLKPGEPLDVPVNVGGEVDQVVYLAFSKDGGRFGTAPAGTDRIIDCLNRYSDYDGRPLEGGSGNGATVRGCLPSDVTVVQHTVAALNP
jgi:hypothetical protein